MSGSSDSPSIGSLVTRRLLLVAALALSFGDAPAQVASGRSDSSMLPPPKAGLEPVAVPALESLESSVAEQVRSVQSSFVALSERAGVTESELADGYGTLGRVYHAYEFTDSAQSCYRNAVRLAPGDHRWPHLLGHLSQQAGRLEEAASHYELARELDAEYVATAIQLGTVHVQLNRLKEARREFEAALALDSDSAAARSGLGEAALADRRYADAIPPLQAALDRVPGADRIHYSLAMAFRGLGDLAKARGHLKQRGSVGIRPKDPLVDGLRELVQGERVHLLRGRMAYGAGWFREAVEAFRKAVEADPNSARARVNLGTALGITGDVAASMEQYRAALRLDPQSSTAHFNLGTLMARTGDYAGAVEFYQSVERSAPDDLEAYRQLARLLQKLGRDDEALRYFSKVVELAPDDEASLIALAEILVDKRLFKETLEVLENAHRRFPNRERTANALARILAACPDPGLRDGSRALGLAMGAYNSTKLLAYGETVALALAELGRCQEAAEWQSRLIGVAARANESELTARLRLDLARYNRGAPCAAAAIQKQE